MAEINYDDDDDDDDFGGEEGGDDLGLYSSLKDGGSGGSQNALLGSSGQAQEKFVCRGHDGETPGSDTFLVCVLPECGVRIKVEQREVSTKMILEHMLSQHHIVVSRPQFIQDLAV